MANVSDRELRDEMRQAIVHLGLSFYAALGHVARSNGMSQQQLWSRLTR